MPPDCSSASAIAGQASATSPAAPATHALRVISFLLVDIP